MGYTTESKLDDVWESLNEHCHNKFGYGDNVKKSTTLEDLQWAKRTLPAYTNWDKFNPFSLFVELWNKKITTSLKKHSSYLNNKGTSFTKPSSSIAVSTTQRKKKRVVSLSDSNEDKIPHAKRLKKNKGKKPKKMLDGKN